MLSPLGWFMLLVGIVGVLGFVFVAGVAATICLFCAIGGRRQNMPRQRTHISGYKRHYH